MLTSYTFQEQEEVRHVSCHEFLTQHALFVLESMQKKGTLSQHFVTPRVVPPLVGMSKSPDPLCNARGWFPDYMSSGSYWVYEYGLIQLHVMLTPPPPLPCAEIDPRLPIYPTHCPMTQPILFLPWSVDARNSLMKGPHYIQEEPDY